MARDLAQQQAEADLGEQFGEFAAHLQQGEPDALPHARNDGDVRFCGATRTRTCAECIHAGCTRSFGALFR